MNNFSITILILLVDLLCLCTGQVDLVYESEKIQDDRRTVLLGGLFPVHATSPTATSMTATLTTTTSTTAILTTSTSTTATSTTATSTTATTTTEACGEIIENSVQRVEAMVYAIDRINENAELLPNIKLAFSIRDTCSDPSYGLEQAFRFVQKSSRDFDSLSNQSDSVAVSGVVGAQFSRVSLDIANLLRLYNIPQISYYSTADKLGDKSKFDYFFRTVPPVSLQARAIADMIIYFNWTYVIMLFSDDAYGREGVDILIKNLQMHSVTICKAARIPLSLTADLKQYDEAVTQMDQDYVRNASVAVLFGHVEAAVGMMEALNRSYIKGNHHFSNLTWIGTDSWGASLPSKYYSIPGGILSILPQADPDPSFDRYFTSLSPATYPNNVWLNELWESRFGCSLRENAMCGIEKNNMTLNTSEYLQANQLTLVIDAVYSFAHAIHSLVESRCFNSILCDEILEDKLLGRGINGELLRDEIFNISFTGVSSNLISFNESGMESGTFVIKNLQDSPIFGDKSILNIVGLSNKKMPLNVTSDIQWATGGMPESICSDRCEGGNQPTPVAQSQCCTSCSPCQSIRGFSDGLSACQDCNESMMPDPSKTACIPATVDFLDFSNTASIVFLTLTVIGLVVTLLIIIVFIVFYKHEVVKASSRESTAFLLVGLLFSFIMPFFFAVMPSPAVCAIRRFGVGVSFSMCFSALLVKTNRIHRIFNQKSPNPNKPLSFISPLSQVIATLILISIQALGSSIWLIVQRPSINIMYHTINAEILCDDSPAASIANILSYNSILMIFSTYYAFHVKKVPHNFNEAKYITITVYLLCIIWLVFASTYFATIRLGSVIRAKSLMFAIILSAATILFCIFIPKMVRLISTLKKNDQDNINLAS